ncbi:O-antigen/teichoic acid export membrane protein [Geobacter argillaceus]|uniref:O-antigen/teichoic acid export membrane protein n=2 Tax=Geobacter argillaceus TaxID=345631 RepID=A0A562W7U4_9BACT|nr:O-antigen/teichoic acid export membrane protein [Geobacter argillaceus]
MSVRRDVFANYLGMIVTALGPMLALPWYLNALGTKQWGLVGFISTIIAVLGMFDAGMGQALIREVAHEKANTSSTATLVIGFERLYWGLSLIAGIAVAVLAKPISTNWLNLGDLPVKLGLVTIYGAALLFTVQFPGVLYRSVLLGLQKHVQLNTLITISGVLRHLGGVLVVTKWPFLEVLVCWQIFVAACDTLARAVLSWKVLGIKRSNIFFCWQEIAPTIKTAFKMSGAVLLGVLTVQLDKIILSRMVTIEQFGYYVIASSLALGALQLVYPITQVALPRIVELINKPDLLHQFNIRLIAIFVMLAISGAVIFVLFGDWLLFRWLRNQDVVSAVYLPLSILLAGTAMNAIYTVGYMNWVARGQVKIISMVNALALLFSLSLIPYLVSVYGIVGAAAAWSIINLIGMIVSILYLIRRYECFSLNL